jgi:formylglycine-generating enzyme required for sulfatase activity
MKKTFLLIFLFASFFQNLGYGQQPKLQGALEELFAGPMNQTDHDRWLNGLLDWRTAEKNKLNYNDNEYLRPEFGWIKKTFIYSQMMAHDRYFYDPVANQYTVDRYLDDVKKRYGGLDAVLIWPTYPNIGIDNRNQFDLLDDMPGGISAVKQMINDFKKQGVRVLFPIMIWDNGTKNIPEPMAVTLVKKMKTLGADGLNGDTMFGVSEDFRTASDSLDYPLALEPENSIKNLKMIEWNGMSWGYYWNYQYVPGVSIYKWLEPRHQVHVTNRWAIDKTDDLQYAFFNGVGYNAWENVWGIWNQIPDRHAETIRRIATIYREFPEIWSSVKWQPHIPTLQKGIYSSQFPGLDKTVYTLINRDTINTNGRQIKLSYQEGTKYFDIWNGIELVPETNGDQLYLSFPLEGLGFGAILAVKEYAVNDAVYKFITRMHAIAADPLKSYSTASKPLPQQMVSVEKTKPGKKGKEMVLIPAAKNYLFKSVGVMIEGDKLKASIGVQHPWEQHPSRSQQHMMEIPSFYMDKYPVTNKQFKKFVDHTRYHPKDDHNFLKDWKDANYPKGWDNKPVTWISIEDARAYAEWAGKRLPHEWEWQYAAQGNDNRLYPWGKQPDPKCIPPPDSSHNMRAPTDVNAYPEGTSPFGVADMVGNVWQWTDEYMDDHTRAAILKGGGYYKPTSSKWYFPQAYELDIYGKYLLMAPSIDRSGTIGFRCVMDK